jgi:hypothetical protein
MLAITTYHHLPLPHDHAFPSVRNGGTLPRAARMAGFGPHNRSRDCAGRPVIAVGHVHEKDPHLGDHSHRFGNRPHSEPLLSPRSVGSRHIVQCPDRVNSHLPNLRNINKPDDSRSDSGLRNLGAAVAVALRDIVAPPPSVASLPLVSFAGRTEGSAFEGAFAGLWPSTST